MAALHQAGLGTEAASIEMRSNRCGRLWMDVQRHASAMAGAQHSCRLTSKPTTTCSQPTTK